MKMINTACCQLLFMCKLSPITIHSENLSCSEGEKNVLLVSLNHYSLSIPKFISVYSFIYKPVFFNIFNYFHSNIGVSFPVRESRKFP